jgi:hypothetical protein
MGMFLESLRIISANAGFSLAHTLIENSGASGSLFRFAELELKGSSEASPYSDELFQIRMTSRLPSNGARIDPELTALLKQTAPEFGQRYDQLDDPVRIEAMILENIRAIFHDLNVRAYHDEIARWFRYSGRGDPPMIFQNNPLDYIIEQSPEGELVFTIARLANIAPKIRYNLHDRGGVWRHADLKQKLLELGINADSLTKNIASFPILYVSGRNDLSVPFFGCKVFIERDRLSFFPSPLIGEICGICGFKFRNSGSLHKESFKAA